MKQSRPTKTGAKSGRRDDVLEAAAALFATKGYAATSIRDIAQLVGLMSGSLYYHFASKEEILLEAHAKGVAQVTDAVHNALSCCPDTPWDRIQAACRGHLTALLGPSPFSQVMTPQFPQSFEGPLRDVLLEQRDTYEQIFRRLVSDLALPPDVDAGLFRLSLLGALNWTLTWYRADGDDSPEDIADNIVSIFRRQF